MNPISGKGAAFLEESLAAAFANSLAQSTLPTVKEYAAFTSFLSLCLKVENVLTDCLVTRALFIGSDGVVSTVSKSGDNEIAFQDIAQLKKVLVKLAKLGFKFAQNGRITTSRVEGTTIYTSCSWNPSGESYLSFSIESAYFP